ncbi:hypothetical protein Tco_0567847 [Tanacetum coccineum]
MLSCKQEEAGAHLNADKHDWKDDPDMSLKTMNWKHIIYTGTDSRVTHDPGSRGTDLYSISQAWLWHQAIATTMFLLKTGTLDGENLDKNEEKYSNVFLLGILLSQEALQEAEYVSLSACCAQVLWLRTQLTDYGFHFDKIPMYCDSKAAIAISCNPVQHSRTKHIDVRYHFIKEQVEKGIVELFFVGTEYQLADLFTKALSEDRFKYLVRRLGMRCLTPDELEALAIESA